MPITVRAALSSNFSSDEIPVEFLVLHYTACSLEDTLEIFSDPEKQVCAHFVIDLDGTIYDLGGFWNGPIYRGAHAGKSSLELQGKNWEAFNKFSIGVEMVNFNGNVFPYTDGQYEALEELALHMKSRFPALQDPQRVVGHEQIAGFRGKSDPGRCFDWKRFYEYCYPGRPQPKRISILNAATMKKFEQLHGAIEPEKLKPSDWAEISAKLEAFAAEKAKIP